MAVMNENMMKEFRSALDIISRGKVKVGLDKLLKIEKYLVAQQPDRGNTNRDS